MGQIDGLAHLICGTRSPNESCLQSRPPPKGGRWSRTCAVREQYCRRPVANGQRKLVNSVTFLLGDEERMEQLPADEFPMDTRKHDEPTAGASIATTWGRLLVFRRVHVCRLSSGAFQLERSDTNLPFVADPCQTPKDGRTGE
jgi:hypothetical protein